MVVKKMLVFYFYLTRHLIFAWLVFYFYYANQLLKFYLQQLTALLTGLFSKRWKKELYFCKRNTLLAFFDQKGVLNTTYTAVYPPSTKW